MNKKQKMQAEMVKLISKKLIEHIAADEDVMNECASILSKKYRDPDYWEDYQEAWGIVESKIKKALGVK
jgi:hypothetical protein